MSRLLHDFHERNRLQRRRRKRQFKVRTLFLFILLFAVLFMLTPAIFRYARRSYDDSKRNYQLWKEERERQKDLEWTRGPAR